MSLFEQGVTAPRMTIKSATHADASDTMTPAPGNALRVTGFMASYSAAFIGLLTITDGVTTIPFYVHNSAAHEFTRPLPFAADAGVTINLPDGGSGVVGKVALFAYEVTP